MSKTSKETAESLYRFYGKSDLNTKQLADLKKAVAALNSIDAAQAKSFFKSHYLTFFERQKFLLA